MMSPDSAFICPRPRNPRACDKCRARKVRCLPSVADRGVQPGSCRRCVKFGHACSNASLSAPLHQARDLGKAHTQQNANQTTKQHVGTVEDVVSGLCEGKVSTADEVDNLLEFHQRAFAEQSDEAATNNNNMLTPESMASTDATGPNPQEPPNLTMPEAECLLTMFRQSERQQYFPFITLPAIITATQMSKMQPFLLLAILTVCSARQPRLQARTDERFRRVLSERVILNGEKGLDYLRGLLVYIAWCPTHLRPLQNVNQITKYMQLAVDMALDQGLDKHDENRTEAENMAYSGTYFLYSFVQGQLSNRPQGMGTKIYMPLPAELNDYSSRNGGSHYLRLQELVGRIAGYKPGLYAPEDCFPTPVQEKMIELMEVLESVLSELSDDMRNTAPTLLTTHYIRLSIAYIPLKPLLQRQRASTPTTSTAPCQHSRSYISSTNLLPHANSTFTEITNFLDTLLSLSLSQYTHFSIREWSQLILTLIISSTLCFSAPPSPLGTSPEWEEFRTQSRPHMIKYLESLADRMRVLSVSPSTSSSSSGKAHKIPDMLAMMDSVLGLLIKNYNAAVQDTGTHEANRVTTCSHTSSSVSAASGTSARDFLSFSPDRIASTSNPSRCPVLNGEIRDTDFWRALEETRTVDPPAVHSGGSTNTATGTGREGLAGGVSVDDLVNHPQDWPSVFGEWVVDLNCLPE